MPRRFEFEFRSERPNPKPVGTAEATAAGSSETLDTGEPSGPRKAASSVDSAPKSVAEFAPLENAPFEMIPWQSNHLLPKTGVVLLVTPPGSCSFALIGFFALHLSGRTDAPFGRAHYPGDVLLSTHSTHYDRALRVVGSRHAHSDKKIYVRRTERIFNWRVPQIALQGVFSSTAAANAAALIIDGGAFPQRLDESIVESAFSALSTMAEAASCLIIVAVEWSSRCLDPFERVPRSLRICRGTLLVSPLRSRALAPSSSDPAEFMLVRLADTTTVSVNVRFTLSSTFDFSMSADILWQKPNYSDPRNAFRHAETADLTVGQREAVRLAVQLIHQSGPATSLQLQAVSPLHGIAKTTMRDALSVANLLGYLENHRYPDGRWYWSLPNRQVLWR